MHLLLCLAMLGSLQSLPALAAAPVPPPPACPCPDAETAAAPAAAAPGERDVARSIGRLDERLNARIEECKERELATAWGEGAKLVAGPIRQIESELLNLLKRHPEDAGVQGELAKLYTNWCVAPEAPSPAVAQLLAGASDPVGLALALTAGETATASATEILFAALTVRPDSAALWMRAASGVTRMDWKIALTAQGVRSLLLAGDGRSAMARTRVCAAAAEEELDLEITWGLLERAARRLAALPEDVRTLIESGASGEAEDLVGGVHIEGRLRDLRLDLALLRLARGDAAGAATLLASARPETPATAGAGGSDYDLPPGSWSPYSRPRLLTGSVDTAEEARLKWTWFQLLETWRLPSQESADPFDLLIASLRSTSASYGRRFAAAEVARRERYPAVAAFLEDMTAGDLRNELARSVFSGDSASPSTPSPAAAEIAELNGELAALASRTEESAREDREEARAALGPDPAAPAVARLLRAPVLEPCAEHPLPRGIVPLGERQMDRRQKKALQGLKLPAGFDVVRAERRGQRAAALGRSLDYGAPALWVILSSDGGATWSRPLYTGMLLDAPYRVRRASSLPLLVGDRLQIEVESDVRAPDASPPLAGARWVTEHAYVEIPIAALRRDSDGDGLTDLAEERLVTDPLDPDSDRDGIPDDKDSLPQLGAAAGASAAVCAAAALVEQAFHITGERGESGSPSAVQGRGQPGVIDDETQFLVSDRQLLSALRPRQRVVVLTPEEMAQAEEKLGAYRYHQLDLFMIDRAGHRAFVLWSWWAQWQNWTGGIIRLEEAEGKWRIEDSQEWTT